MSLEKEALYLAAKCAVNNRWEREVFEFPSVGFTRAEISDCTLRFCTVVSDLQLMSRLPVVGLLNHNVVEYRLCLETR